MKWSVLALCALSLLLYAYNPQSRDFWAPDEGDFAEIARELHGDSIVPHLNNKPYGEKPPLFYYMTYGSHRALPFLADEISMRLPTALLAVAFALFFFLFARAFLGKEEALISAAILITTPLYYWQARYLQVDMAFSVFAAGGLLSFFRYAKEGRRPFYYLFFVFTALSFMTKGPLAVALMFPPALVYLALQRDFSPVRRKETVIGILIVTAIVAPWYLAVYFREGFPYLYENIIRQNMVRFVDAWSHRRPFYYYFTTLPLDFFPWSLFLPLGLYRAWTRKRSEPVMMFALVWFVWIFLFLSFSSGKISKYMLPLVPALALMTSGAFTGERNSYRTAVSLFLGAVFVALGAALLFYRTGWYPAFSPERMVLGFLSVVLGAALFYCVRKRKPLAAFAALSAFMVIAYGTANVSIWHKWNPMKSPRPLTERIKPYLKDGAPWVYYGSMRGTYVYYVGTYAIHINEHDTKALGTLGTEKKEFFILTRKRDMDEVAATLPGVRVLFEHKIGDTAMVFAGYRR